MEVARERERDKEKEKEKEKEVDKEAVLIPEIGVEGKDAGKMGFVPLNNSFSLLTPTAVAKAFFGSGPVDFSQPLFGKNPTQ